MADETPLGRIGTGLPTEDNTHEVAQRVDPSSRILHVDNDPVVLLHARVLPSGSYLIIEDGTKTVEPETAAEAPPLTTPALR